jgi:6,7-dimethyl-8-ribityllumazine synthase
MPGRIRYRILIIEGRFYDHICDALLEGAIAELEARAGRQQRPDPGHLPWCVV